jgi:acetyl-CoA synthetase
MIRGLKVGVKVRDKRPPAPCEDGRQYFPAPRWQLRVVRGGSEGGAAVVRWTPIAKSPRGHGAPLPNLVDYDAARAGFSWDSARDALDGLPDGGINIAHEAVDRHAVGAASGKVALRCLRRNGGVRDITYGELAELTSRFAQALDHLGVGVGDRVFVLLPRVPELYVAALGTLKHRSVLSPLFSAFGPEPIRQRLEIGEGRVLVTTAGLFRRRVASQRDALRKLEHVLIIDEPAPEGTILFPDLLAAMPGTYEIGSTNPEMMALLHFTSGTTGTPKGAIHVHDAVVQHHVTGSLALDLHADDVFWCTADPGWVTGTSYGIISPLTHGVTSIIDESEFEIDRWYATLADQRVSVWYTAPTALRMLMAAGAEPARAHDLSALRFIASVGEPLNPEVVNWTNETLGIPAHDNWWQTETGGIMIANFAAMTIRPGSMGKPMPGVEAVILQRNDEEKIVLGPDGAAVEVPDGTDGMLALRPGWPSMFRGYLGEPERYEACFTAGWYISGDLARRDQEGYFWFVGRGDDVIKSAGHLIGPFEVESVLMEHPSVVEAGVIGIPDAVAGEVVKAYVVLHWDVSPTDDLRLELIGFARKRLGAAIAPRDVAFAEHLPHTQSGKIVRRVLKQRALGLPEGDTSTLEAAT